MQGDVFVCCPPWCSSYSFGNIYEQSFDEIWNGDRAKIFRKQFIEGNYNICDLNLCVKDCSKKVIPTEVCTKPKTFIFCYDSMCNVKCIFCRSSQQKQDLSFFDNKNLEELGIINKLTSITVSLHSIKKDTYDKLVVGGNYEKVMENIKFLSSLKLSGKLDRLIFNFVVNAYNYREMVDYIKLARKYSATVGFLELLKLDTNKEVFEDLNIFSEKHPKYNDFVKVLKNPIFRTDACTINDCMLNLKPISFKKSLKYKLERIFKR